LLSSFRDSIAYRFITVLLSRLAKPLPMPQQNQWGNRVHLATLT
jgi:hypothetical protein